MKLFDLLQPVTVTFTDSSQRLGASVEVGCMTAWAALLMAAEMLKAQQRDNEASYRSLAALEYLEAVLAASRN